MFISRFKGLIINWALSSATVKTNIHHIDGDDGADGGGIRWGPSNTLENLFGYLIYSVMSFGLFNRIMIHQILKIKTLENNYRWAGTNSEKRSFINAQYHDALHLKKLNDWLFNRFNKDLFKRRVKICHLYINMIWVESMVPKKLNLRRTIH